MATCTVLSVSHPCRESSAVMLPAAASRCGAIGGRHWLVATAVLLGLGILAGVEVQAQTPSAYWGGPLPSLTSATGHSLSTAPGLKSPVIGNDSAGQQPALPPLAITASNQPLIITGTVYRANGVPLSGTQVDLAGEWGKHLFATTDAEGKFRFAVDKDSLGEFADVSVMRFPMGLSRYPIGHLPFLDLYRYASADIDFVSNQPYKLRLGHIKRRRPYHCVKFR